jgi:chaperone BCS1
MFMFFFSNELISSDLEPDSETGNDSKKKKKKKQKTKNKKQKQKNKKKEATTMITDASAFAADASSTASVNVSDSLSSFLKGGDSAFVQSLLIMLFVGTVTSVFYWVYNTLTDFFWRSVLVSITVTKPDVGYMWLAAWLAANRDQLLTSTNVTLSVLEKEQSRSYWRRNEEEEVLSEKNMQFLPGEGQHLFKFNGRWVWLNRSISSPVAGGFYSTRPIITETLTVSMIGRTQAPLIELFLEGMKLQRREETNITKVYSLEDGWDWRVASSRRPRPLDSVVLDGNIMASIVDDLRLFLRSEQDYINRGISYQRGFLFYGPPGCGKSSACAAIAGALGLSICVLNLSNRTLDDESLNSRLIDAPSNSIILLEDIDSIFVGRASASASPDELFRGGGNNGPNISFSGLLNALDGVASRQGRVMFMTTNHIEKLDPALIRPGRVDVKIKFDLASATQAQQMFKRFFPGEDALASEVTNVLQSKAVSPAALQGHFLKFPGRPLEAINALPELLVSIDKNDNAPMLIGIWLKRLALPQRYGELLRRLKVLFVSDLVALAPAELVALIDIKNELHKARVTHFLEGDETVKQQFSLCKRNAVELVFRKYCSNATDDQVARFASTVGPDQVSTFELEFYLAQFVNEPRKAIERIDELLDVAAVVDSRSLLMRSTRISDGPTVEQFLIDAKMSTEVIEKFKEENITDMDHLLSLETGDFSSLGVEKRGDQYRLEKAIEARKKEIELCL